MIATRTALVDAEDLAQVAPQLLDVVADAANAELAKVREILPNLRRVEVELLGERARRDGPHAGGVERVEAAQVDRQPVGGQLGNRRRRRRAGAVAAPLFAFFTSSDVNAGSGITVAQGSGLGSSSSRDVVEGFA